MTRTDPMARGFLAMLGGWELAMDSGQMGKRGSHPLSRSFVPLSQKKRKKLRHGDARIHDHRCFFMQVVSFLCVLQHMHVLYAASEFLPILASCQASLRSVIEAFIQALPGSSHTTLVLARIYHSDPFCLSFIHLGNSLSSVNEGIYSISHVFTE